MKKSIFAFAFLAVAVLATRILGFTAEHLWPSS